MLFMNKKIFDSITKLLSVTAVTALVIPAIYILTYYSFGKNSWIMLTVFCTLFISAGYLMQSFYGTATKARYNGRKDYSEDSGFETYTNPFSPAKAALPLTVAVLITIVMFPVCDKLMYFAYTKNIIRYSENSLFILIGPLTAFLMMFLGIYLWFLPAHRIISMKSVLSYFGVMCPVFALSVMMSVPTKFLGASFTVFAICSFVVLNQSYIKKSVTGTVTAISNEGKLYNFKLTVVAVAALLFLLLIFSALFTGISFFVKLLMAYVLTLVMNKTSEGDDKYYDVSEATEKLQGVMPQGQSAGDKFLIILCVILFVVGIVFFLTRGIDFTKKLVKKIKAWLTELFLAFMDMKSFFEKGDREYTYMNYHDEEINLQDAVIKSYDPKKIKNKSYREFVSQLNSLPTYSDQIRYAYVTMLSVFYSLGYGIRSAETPRETSVRVNARSAENNIDVITNVLECVDYIEREPDEKESERVIKDMCRIIENHFDE